MHYAWTPVQRVLFRFIFVYLALYSLPFVLGPFTDQQARLWFGRLLTPMAMWLGAHLFGVSQPVVVTSLDDADTVFVWLAYLSLLLAAAIAAAVWSALDRTRLEYRTLHDWLRTLVRYSLGFVMVQYGIAKVLPQQFPPPRLETLLTTYGQSSPSTLLWTFMGHSWLYSMYGGLGELIGGLLLFFRRTALLGAIVCAAVLTNVVMVNVSFAVGAKLYTLHLFLMAVFVAGPDLRRLANVLLFNRLAEPAGERPLTQSAVGRRVQLAIKTLILAMVVGRDARAALRFVTTTPGAFAPKPPLYGIYEVTAFTRNGQQVPPLLGDSTRWRRVVLPENPNGMLLYMANDSLRRQRVTVDTTAHSITMQARGQVIGTLHYTSTAGGMLLQGMVAGDSLRVELRRTDRNAFPLLRPFQWVVRE